MARRSGSRLRTALKFPLVPRAHPRAQKLRLIATRAEAVSRKASSISGLLVLETIIAHRVSYYTKHRNRKQSTKLRLVNFSRSAPIWMVLFVDRSLRKSD